ncbi:MAG: dihydrolipoamide acetyltransferase family protein [Acidimicrobiia bacterium]
MSYMVTMPQLGETVTEGTILRWMKQPGDLVAEDDPLLEISTDKVDTEVPSPFSGTLLEILVPEGETVDVGTVLAVIGEEGETIEAAAAGASVTTDEEEEEIPELSPPPVAPSPPAASPSTAVTPVASAGGTLGVLSPVVRRLAAEHGIDLAAVTGTGRDGRITRRDVEGFIGSGPPVSVAVPPPAARAETPPRKAGLGRGIEELLADNGQPPVEIVGPEPPSAAGAPPTPVTSGEEPIGRLRSRIAANMIKAKQTAAHVWTSMEVDFENVERTRQKLKAAFKEREGFGLTYLPFISRATIDALAAFPVVNSSFDLEGGTRTFHGHVNLGIGVDLDQEGLVVMTMRDADGLRLRGIGREVRRLADKARRGDLEPDDLAGSTFTITNPGPFGSYMSAPIINVPNVAILSTDGIKKRPVVVSDDDGNDAIAIRHVGYLGLTWDHRAFDGSTALLFLGRIRENLETWDWELELA